VRYRKPDGAQTDKRGFARKKDAEAFAATVEVAKLTGDYIDPAKGKVTVGSLAERWLALKSKKKASYQRDLESAWRIHVQPYWSATPIGGILPSEVHEWANSIDKSPTVVHRARGVLAGILDLAVSDKLIRSNPARDATVELPRKQKGRHAYLTAAQVDALARESRYGALVRFLALTGLRWGEAVALDGDDIDWRRRRILVTKSMTYRGGEWITEAVKTWESREVPIPDFILKLVPRAMPGVPVWQVDGDRVKRPNADHGWFAGAVNRCRATDKRFPRVTPHDLRHTAASLAVQSGANVKAVQRMLGHASAAVTLDVYADLFDTDLDAVASALSESVGKMWAEG
jgi:integrase